MTALKYGCILAGFVRNLVAHVPTHALGTELMPAVTVAPFVLWDSTATRASIIVVIGALACWFLGLIDGVERSYFCHVTPSGVFSVTPLRGRRKHDVQNTTHRYVQNCTYLGDSLAGLGGQDA